MSTQAHREGVVQQAEVERIEEAERIEAERLAQDEAAKKARYWCTAQSHTTLLVLICLAPNPCFSNTPAARAERARQRRIDMLREQAEKGTPG